MWKCFISNKTVNVRIKMWGLNTNYNKQALFIRWTTIFMVGVEYLHYLILTRYYWGWSFCLQGSVRITDSSKVYAFTILIATICNLAHDMSDYALRNPEKWLDPWMALGSVTGVPSAQLPFKGSAPQRIKIPTPSFAVWPKWNMACLGGTVEGRSKGSKWQTDSDSLRNNNPSPTQRRKVYTGQDGGVCRYASLLCTTKRRI